VAAVPSGLSLTPLKKKKKKKKEGIFPGAVVLPAHTPGSLTAI
jgi:hypothetical protein